MPHGLRLLLLPLVAVLLAACAQTPTLPGQGSDSQGTYTPNPQPAQETELQYRARLHTELGANYLYRGQVDVALEELNEALKLVPDYAPAYNVLALLYLDLGEFDKAEANFSRALKIAPQDPEIHNNYGWYLCQRGRERDGLAQFEFALSNPLYRTPELALLNSGACHLRLNELSAADAAFKRALVLQPNNTKALTGLAEVAYREGRYRDARMLLRLPLQAAPPPSVLYLAACVEGKLGDKAAEQNYASDLRGRYPEAPEVKKLESGLCP